MIHFCHQCGDQISLDAEWFPFCGEACEWASDHDYDDYQPGDEQDYDPLEDHEIGWEDVHDGYDPWGYER